MPKLKLNLADFNDGFDPIPEGTYNAYVFEVKYKEFKSGNDGYSVQYKISDGEYKGRRIFDNIVLTEKAYFKVAQFYKAITGASSTAQVTIDTDEFKNYVGKLVEVKVAVEEGQDGEDRNVIKNVKYVEGEKPQDADNLNDMLAEREPVGAGIDISDDDLLF